MKDIQDDKFTVRTTKEQGQLIRTAYEFLRRNETDQGRKPPSVNSFLTEAIMDWITSDQFRAQLVGGEIE